MGTVQLPHRNVLLASAGIFGLLVFGFLATRLGNDALRGDRSERDAFSEYDVSGHGEPGTSLLGIERTRALFRNASATRQLPPEAEVAGAVETGRGMDPSKTPTTKCDTRRLTVIALSECTDPSGKTNILVDVGGAVTLSVPEPEVPEEVQEVTQPVAESPPPTGSAQVDRAEAPATDLVREEAAVLLDAGQPLLQTTGGLGL